MSRKTIPVVEIISRGPSSRASSTSRNMATGRLTRQSLRQNDATIVRDSEDDSSALISCPLINVTTTTGKAKVPESRASMSSVSTVNDYGEASDYSTPATSAFATPAPVSKTENGTSARRGRRPASTATTELPPSALNAFQRAKNLRNSEFALNPIGMKRKRTSIDDDEEEENFDEDDSPDAQLARALQEQEDAKANEMVDDEEDFTPRRTRQGLRQIISKADYMVNNSEDDLESESPTRLTTITKRTKRTKYMVQDSDLSSDESEFKLDSDEDEDLPLAKFVAANGRKKTGFQKTETRMHEVVHQQSLEYRNSPYDASGLFLGKPGLKNALATLDPDMIEASGLIPDTETSLSPLSELDDIFDDLDDDSLDDLPVVPGPARSRRRANTTRSRAVQSQDDGLTRRARADRARLEQHHPELKTMWIDLQNLPEIKKVKAEQPTNISRELKPFQLEGLNWMQEMEKREWGGGLLGDEMGMGKTIQAVSLIMSDYPAKNPSLVLIPPVALMQWQQEIGDYTQGLLKTFVFHGTNLKTKAITTGELKKYDVILMSYNSLESMYRHQEKGFRRKEKVHKEKSVIHQIRFHRVILDEAHNIKQRSTSSAKACFALKADHKWCLSGTPLQNRIGEFFSLIRFLDIRPFACYFCKQCPCNQLEWSMNSDNRCTSCNHSGMHHVSVFNQELLNPIQKFGNKGPGKVAFEKLRLLTDRFMLRRIKRDHSAAMELPAKEIYVDRQFFGEEENDFAGSIMNSGNRKFETYVAQGVLLNNYANVFGLIMQMRQVADHPDLILKKNGEGGQNILVCCICDDVAEDAIRSACKHDFCRSCVKHYILSEPDTDLDCPRCHIPLAIDLEQPEMEQNEELVKKSSIINRIKMENWTSSTKIEALVHELYKLRSPNSSTKSIIFSGFTTMLQLVEWRLRRAGITSVMLDGSMTPAQRQASINAFMTNPNIECFLVSLKAGGVALNLTEASKVFIVDPWWNPAAEWQSADRCHRIGQCRPCSITRLCIEDSVESRMVLLQEKKTNMIHSTINNDDTAMESLTPEDMQFLFRGS